MFEAGKCKGKNFISFEDIEFDFAKWGTVLVEGVNMDNLFSSDSNGSGKSTLSVELIPFALYGKTLRGLKKDEVIRAGCDECWVIFEFKKNGDEYKVERHRGKEVSLSFFKNGVDETTSDLNETQKKIDEVIPYNLYVNGICFSGSVFESFVLASDSEKKEIMSDMFGLSLFENARKASSEKCSNLQNDRLKLSTKMEQIDEDIVKLEEEKKEYKAFLDNFDDKELNKKKKLEEEFSVKLEKIEEEIRKSRREKEKTSDKKEQLWNLKHKYEMGKSKNEGTYEKDEGELKKIEALKEKGKCPTCGQEISGKYKTLEIDTLKNHMETLKVEIAKEEKAIEKIEIAIKNIVEEIVGKTNLISKKETEQEDFKSKKEELHEYVNEKSQEMDKYSEKLKDIEANIKTKKVDKKSKQKEILQVESDLKIYEFWKEGFSSRGISNFILELHLPTLNNLINEYIGYMFDESIQIEFKPYEMLKNGSKKERWSIDIKGWTDSYVGCSAGERRRIDLVIMLAMNQMLRSRLGGTNLMIIDEALDPLDEKGVRKVLDLLSEKMSEVESLFVVTHEHELGESFDKKIVVKKKNGISVLTDETD